MGTFPVHVVCSRASVPSWLDEQHARFGLRQQQQQQPCSRCVFLCAPAATPNFGFLAYFFAFWVLSGFPGGGKSLQLAVAVSTCFTRYMRLLRRSLGPISRSSPVRISLSILPPCCAPFCQHTVLFGKGFHASTIFVVSPPPDGKPMQCSELKLCFYHHACENWGKNNPKTKQNKTKQEQNALSSMNPHLKQG